MKRALLLMVTFVSCVTSVFSKGNHPDTLQSPVIHIHNIISTGPAGSLFSLVKYFSLIMIIWEGGARYCNLPEFGCIRKIVKPFFNWLKGKTKDKVLKILDFICAQSGNNLRFTFFIESFIKPFINWFFDVSTVSTRNIIDRTQSMNDQTPDNTNAGVDMQNRVHHESLVQINGPSVKKKEDSIELLKNNKSSSYEKQESAAVTIDEKRDVNPDYTIAQTLVQQQIPVISCGPMYRLRNTTPGAVTLDAMNQISVSKESFSPIEQKNESFAHEFEQLEKKNKEKDQLFSQIFNQVSAKNRIAQDLNSKRLPEKIRWPKHFPKFYKLPADVQKRFTETFIKIAGYLVSKDLLSNKGNLSLDATAVFNKHMVNLHRRFEVDSSLIYKQQSKVHACL